MTMKRLLCIFLILVNVVIAGACSSPNGATNSAKRDYWPTQGWKTSTPEIQNIDSAKLQDAMKAIDNAGVSIDAAVIVRHGYVVLEENLNPDLYDLDSLHTVHSITKSVTSALIGIAIKEGFIKSVDQKIIDFFPELTIDNLDDWKRSMTIENVLTMTSGLLWDETSYPYTDPRNSLVQATISPNFVQFVLNLPMASEPGIQMVYNTGSMQLLTAIITRTTGLKVEDFARKYLFSPIGISNFIWSADSQGINYGGGQLLLSPMDMAKFGYLYLNNGLWDGKQIVPTDWVVKSTSPNTMNFTIGALGGYGYLWWLKPKDFLSDNYYYAGGLYGQRIYVLPKLDMIVVFTLPNRNQQTEAFLNALLYPFIAACKDVPK